MSWGPWLLGDVVVPQIEVDGVMEPLPAFTLSRRQLGAVVALARALAEGEWCSAARPWARYLDAGEREEMVTALLRAAPGQIEAEALVEAALRVVSGGPPLPTLLARFQEEAEGWAAVAPEAELKHYLLAAFRRLPARDRVAFLRAAQKAALA